MVPAKHNEHVQALVSVEPGEEPGTWTTTVYNVSHNPNEEVVIKTGGRSHGKEETKDMRERPPTIKVLKGHPKELGPGDKLMCKPSGHDYYIRVQDGTPPGERLQPATKVKPVEEYCSVLSGLRDARTTSSRHRKTPVVMICIPPDVRRWESLLGMFPIGQCHFTLNDQAWLAAIHDPTNIPEEAKWMLFVNPTPSTHNHDPHLITLSTEPQQNEPYNLSTLVDAATIHYTIDHQPYYA
jgi:hypothetical protein